MKYLWMVLVVLLSACEGSGKAPVPVQGEWAKFAGATADDSQGSSVNSCSVNVLTLEKNILTSYYHKPKVGCDCSTVQPRQAAECVGERLNADSDYVVKAVTSRLLTQVLNISPLCPALQGVQGIPFIPPDCLGGTVEKFNKFISTPVVKFPGFVVGVYPASKKLDINTAVISSSKSYVTREGELAHSVIYKKIERAYEGCELDAQIVFSIDVSGDLIPARRSRVLTAEANPPELNLVPLEYHLSSEPSQKCVVKASTSDNANSTAIDNALSPYAGLGVEYEFGALDEGVLTLDYTERFYKTK